MALSSEKTLNLSLDVPDACYVVVGAGEQVLSMVAPLEGLDEVVLVCPRRHVIVNLRQADVPELNQGLRIGPTCALQHAVQSSARSAARERHSLRAQQIVVPYVHKHVASAAGRQQPLVWIPLGEEYLAVMFTDHAYALSVGHQRYLVGQCVLCAILLYAIVLLKGDGLDFWRERRGRSDTYEDVGGCHLVGGCCLALVHLSKV